MSRPLTAGPPSTDAVPGAAGSPRDGRHGPGPRRPGRHRLGNPAGVRCSDLPAVRARLQSAGRTPQRRNAFVQWLLTAPPSGRHTWSFLAQAGGRPRTAFAIILSL